MTLDDIQSLDQVYTAILTYMFIPWTSWSSTSTLFLKANINDACIYKVLAHYNFMIIVCWQPRFAKRSTVVYPNL
jgi:hypothetical protein